MVSVRRLFACSPLRTLQQHSVRRTRTSKEEAEAQKKREQSKIAEYLALTDQVLSRKKQKYWSEDALELTSKLLQVNPEFYTIWNYRRNIFLNGLFPQSAPEQINELLLTDLAMTMKALKTHPKVYWIWNHRRWCLENIPAGPGSAGEENSHAWQEAAWEKDLFVAEEMLDADSRNFHAWDYRRYILANTPKIRPPKSELTYTKQKILSNFSNFSAWHQRSKVLSSLWASGKLSESKSKESEFKLIRDAMYTDPHDQSVWIYHRWLIGSDCSQEILEREIELIRELLAEQPDRCLESLVHYNRMLLENHKEKVDGQALTVECRGFLEQLKELDPMRSRRYSQLGMSSNSANVFEMAH
ncbi:Geranylgeranyl transferase type-2 subunit alpha [Leucoagaricus sp. SymC.cos]|nr:Geranylgeranyl transferase type-2 subunit alpha [Leucoagaricus sp. SymC.cos]